MPIVTNFGFQHDRQGLAVARGALGPLSVFTRDKLSQTWQGTGFNLIWRPNVPGESGPDKFFLQLNLTKEEVSFNDISGPTGVANRGLFQRTIFLGALSYLHTASDSFDSTDQHFEPGVWGNVVATTDPLAPASVFRMGSIPHGTTINLQGYASTIDGAPNFRRSSIVPFRVGTADDGVTNLASLLLSVALLDEDSPSRTLNSRVPSLSQAQLFNPHLFLTNVISSQSITKTTIFQMASNTDLLHHPDNVSGAVDIGGGTNNIAFLVGRPPGDAKGYGRPNANAPVVTATYLVEEGTDDDGSPLVQLQYTQRVLLNFNGLSWPHISVATLKAVSPSEKL